LLLSKAGALSRKGEFLMRRVRVKGRANTVQFARKPEAKMHQEAVGHGSWKTY
jgi:hypothetical protein